MIQISPVIHLYENEIQPQIVCSPTTVVVKFHTNCDLFSLFEFLKQRLTESEWQVFTNSGQMTQPIEALR